MMGPGLTKFPEDLMRLLFGFSTAVSSSLSSGAHRIARILHGIAELARGIAKNVIPIAIEDGYLVAMSQQAFATLVVQNDDEIRFSENVSHGEFWTAFIKGLNYFSSLRSGSA